MQVVSLPDSGHPLNSALGTEKACKNGQRKTGNYPNCNEKEEKGKAEVSRTESILLRHVAL